MKHVLDAVNERMALNAFFHASRTPLPLGEELIAREGPSAATPSLVNDLRPAGMPKRQAHFFMIDKLDCLHLYEVRPTAQVTRGNYGWIKRIYDIAADDDDYKKNPKAVRAALSYWSGEPFPKMPCEKEYLTTSFIAQRDLGHLGEHVPLTPAGDLEEW